MTPSALAIIGVTIVFSSFISGVFGMAGGMVLLGVLLNYFDVATGMILFSIIQLFAEWMAGRAMAPTTVCLFGAGWLSGIDLDRDLLASCFAPR